MKPQYTQDDLDMALQAIAGGKLVRKAALEWGIPGSTLQDRVHGTELTMRPLKTNNVFR